ncbi:HNH endonuclease signature motif containing protein [Rhodococcus sp. BH5]|uniref:HNH endonuclease signature motif containing protein n=1 Tax=Rhodococcus sp. BH5 TaxID=2871702 RepID=UPI0009ED36BF
MLSHAIERSDIGAQKVSVNTPGFRKNLSVGARRIAHMFESKTSADALFRQHAEIARAHFLEIDAVTALYLDRCEEDAAVGVNEAFRGQFAHVEIASILSITEYAAQKMIALGCDLRWRLPRVAAAFACGDIDLAKAMALSEALANVSEHALDDIERLLVDGACRVTGNKLKARARGLIARHDPDGVRARRVRAEADRDVRTCASHDGMSTLDGMLPAVGAQTLATRLRAMSMQVCGSDPRTFGQRRADALIALAEGKTSLDCQCDGDCTRRDDTKTSALPIATILVGVNASTLLGFDDLPGYLQGYGHIDADLARAIAADATWQRVLTLAPSEVQHCSTAGAAGPVLGVGRSMRSPEILPAAARDNRSRRNSGSRRGESTYQPSAALVTIVRTRDGTCRFPNCVVRSDSCDIDHTVPFDHGNPAQGGPTAERNLACLCRKHHRLKTFGRWTVKQIGGGLLEWKDPSGRRTVTAPVGPFCDPELRVPDAARLHLTDGDALERRFGLRDRGVEADLEYLLDWSVPGWRKARSASRRNASPLANALPEFADF